MKLAVEETQEAGSESTPAQAPAAKTKSPFGVVRRLASLTMVSRLLGFVRDVLMAMTLGTGLIADAFFLAWALPNLARRLFGEGAFSAALVPVFVDAREQGDAEGARQLVSAVLTRLAIGLVALVLVLTLGCVALTSPGGLELLGSLGLSASGLEKISLALGLATTLLPYMVFICLAGVLGGALNALDRFTVPAAAPVVLNIVWIGALLVGPLLVEGELSLVRFLTLALVGGGVIQLMMHTGAMKRAECPVTPTLRADPGRIRRVRGLFFSLALGLALFQLNVFFDGLIAYTLVEEGGVSTLYFANRLVQLPIGVFGVALATAVFPALTRLAKRGETEELGRTLERGVRLGAFIAIPAAVGLVALAEPIVSTLFERGRFDAASTARTGFCLLLLAPAVITACVTSVVTRAFYAEEQVKTPVRVGAACVLLNLTLNLLLVGPLQEAGLALATSISQGINLVAQVWLYRARRIAKGDTTRSAQTAKVVVQCSLLALLMGAAAYGAHAVCPGPDALRLGVGVAVGAVLYGGLSLALRMQEPRLLLRR